MTRKMRLPMLAGAAVVFASGSLLAAQIAQQKSGAQTSAARSSSAVSTMMVGQPNNTGSYKGPGSGFAALSANECEAFGGKVVTAAPNSCTATGKVCYTANKDGSIHQSCITE
jgi:hypothetical protein